MSSRKTKKDPEAQATDDKAKASSIEPELLARRPPDAGLTIEIDVGQLKQAGVLGTEYPWARGYSPDIRAVPEALVDPSPLNHRSIFTRLEELGRSIQAEGLRTSLLARPSPKTPGRIELVVGERRLRAMRLVNTLAVAAGLPAPWASIPMRIRALTDAEVIIEQAIENLDREDPHPLEEALIYERLCKPVAEGGQGFTVEQAAAKTRRDPAHIVGSMRLLELRPKSREAFLKDDIKLGHALVLARVPRPDKGKDLQDELLNDIMLGRSGLGRPADAAVMTVAATKARAREHYMLPIAKAPFDPTDATLNPAQGACSGCSFNTDTQTLLFGGDIAHGSGLCTKPDCWETKLDENWKRKTAKAKKEGVKVLSQADTKKLFPYSGDHTAHDSEYVRLDETCYQVGGGLTYRTIVKKAEGEKPPLVLCRTENRREFELVARADVERIVRSLKREESQKTLTAGEETRRKRQREEKERARIGNIVFRAVMTALVVAMEKLKDVNETTLRLLARALVQSVWADTLGAVVLRRDLLPKVEEQPKKKGKKARPTVGGLEKKNKDNEALLLEHIDGLKTKGQLLGVLLEVTLTRAAAGMPVEGARGSKEFADVCAALKIDVKAISAQVTAAEKKDKAPGKKGGKKAAKASAKPPKRAPARRAAEDDLDDDDEEPSPESTDKPDELRRGGPEKCPKPCVECPDGDHHFSDVMMGSAEDEPEHVAAKAGALFWHECKHCPAWREWDPDADEDEDIASCRVCTCTEEEACEERGAGCVWMDAEMTLCSACAHLLDRAEELCAGKGHTPEELAHLLDRAAAALYLDGDEATALEELTPKGRKLFVRLYSPERINATIAEAARLGRIKLVDGRYHEATLPPELGPGPAPFAAAAPLPVPIAEAPAPEGMPSAEDIARGINDGTLDVGNPDLTATVVPADGPTIVLREPVVGSTPLFCVMCERAPDKDDDLCPPDRALVDQVIEGIWAKTATEDHGPTEDEVKAIPGLDAGPRRIDAALGYLRKKELIAPDTKGRIMFTPLPSSVRLRPRSKEDRDRDILVVEALKAGADTAAKIPIVVGASPGPVTAQVLESLRFLAGSSHDNTWPDKVTGLAEMALAKSLAALTAEPGSREELIDGTLRKELEQDKLFSHLMVVAARALGPGASTPRVLALEVRAALARIGARACAMEGYWHLVRVLTGPVVCAICTNELVEKSGARCPACLAIVKRVVDCITEHPKQWSPKAMVPEDLKDGGAPVRNATFKRAVDWLVRNGVLLLDRGKLYIAPGAGKASAEPTGEQDGAATWKELMGPSKVEQRVHHRLHLSAHHRALVVGVGVARTAAILAHMASPRRDVIYILEHSDELAGPAAIMPLQVELLVRHPEPVKARFDRVLVMPSPIDGEHLFDEVVALENAYERTEVETGRLVAVMTKAASEHEKVKALVARHNGAVEPLEDDKRLGTDLVLVQLYKVTVAGRPAGKLQALPGGNSARPSLPAAAARKTGGKAAAKPSASAKRAPKGDVPDETA